MRTVGIVVVLLFSSCVRTSTVTCGDLTCEAGSVCSPTGNFCTTQAQIDACVDADTPATTCTAPGERPGVCRDGYCQEVRCGDERIDPGEVCDDGNVSAGDACSPDCTSDESCGNDVLDRGREDCDDGNQDAHDGCSAACRTESPIWRQFIDTRFAARSGHSMVYDSARKRVVLFGGKTAAVSNETWEYDGDQWTLRTPSTSPPSREEAMLAYDPVRQKTVLFGGKVDDQTMLGDTWEWDGTTWTQKFPAASPSARRGSPVAFHPGRAAVVIYSGSTGTTDTWEWNGTTWTDRTTTAGSIGKGEGAAMSYDPAVGGLVLFGPSASTQTWRYDGTWTTLTMTSPIIASAAVTPRGRTGYSMAYDASVGRTILLGGSQGACGLATGCSDGFELRDDGGSSFHWESVSAPYSPAYGAVAYDTDTSELVVMGGLLAGISKPQDATWRRKDTYWRVLYTPPPRPRCELAYLPSLGGSVMYGGVDLIVGVDATDTWLLKDGVWSRLRPVTSPTKADGAMTLDRARNKLVRLDQTSTTWEFDGTNWSSIATATSPTPRSQFQLVYDDVRAAVVMFGGYEPITKLPLGDTWIYNGTTWTQLTTTVSPPPLYGYAMSYDRARDVVVLFGQLEGGPTWELSGSTWTEKVIAGPTPRTETSMAFDPKRRSSVMFSGSSFENGRENDTWEYVDGAWREAATLGPPPRTQHCSTYDESLEKVVIVSGNQERTVEPDTWLFGYE